MKSSSKLVALTLLLSVFFISSCSNKTTTSDKNYDVKTEGTIKAVEMTVYQYGSFILVDSSSKTTYALKSENISLNSFLDKKVLVQGDLVAGYPVDTGPEYLDVKTLQIVD